MWDDVADDVLDLEELAKHWDMSLDQLYIACNGGLVGRLKVKPYTISDEHCTPSGRVEYRLSTFDSCLPHPLTLHPHVRSRIVFKLDDVVKVDLINPKHIFAKQDEDDDPGLQDVQPEKLMAIHEIEELLKNIELKNERNALRAAIMALKGAINAEIGAALARGPVKDASAKSQGSRWINKAKEILIRHNLLSAEALLDQGRQPSSRKQT